MIISRRLDNRVLSNANFIGLAAVERGYRKQNYLTRCFSHAVMLIFERPHEELKKVYFLFAMIYI